MRVDPGPDPGASLEGLLALPAVQELDTGKPLLGSAVAVAPPALDLRGPRVESFQLWSQQSESLANHNLKRMSAGG